MAANNAPQPVKLSLPLVSNSAKLPSPFFPITRIALHPILGPGADLFSLRG